MKYNIGRMSFTNSIHIFHLQVSYYATHYCTVIDQVIMNWYKIASV